MENNKHRKSVISNPLLSFVGQMIGQKIAMGGKVFMHLDMMAKNDLTAEDAATVGKELNTRDGDGITIGLQAAANGSPLEIAFLIKNFTDTYPEVGNILLGMLKMKADPEGVNDEMKNAEKAIRDLMKDL